MNAQDLKNSILQRAIEGKLVPQRKEEGTAKELLAEIRAEKEKLIKAKKIKKQRKLAPILFDDIPFDIPKNWAWVRLEEILLSLTDGTHKTPIYKDEGIPFLSVKNISNYKIDFSNLKYISIEEHKKLCKRCCPKKGDILLSKVGTTGIPVIIDTEKEFSIFVSVALLKISSLIDAKFLLILLESPLVQTQCQMHTRGVGNKNWVLTDIANTLVSLPPLAEQHRIVARIEELQPDIDAYDKAHTELRTIEQHFPDDMKKSLLQYAIEGKLVPQRKEEGTARELLAEIRAEKEKLIKAKKIKKTKPLPEITDDEKPFEIPDSWEWVRFEDIFEIARGGSPRPIKQFLTQSHDGINWIKIGDTEIGDKYIVSTKEKIIPKGLSKSRLVEVGDLLLTNSMSYGRPYILKTRGAIHDGWLVLSPYFEKINKEFFYYIISSPYVHNQFARTVSGAVVKNLNKDKVKKIFIPLPPLVEQHRIVARIEELLPLCRQLAGETE